MIKIRIYLSFSMICILLCILSGCYSSSDYPGIREQTVYCVENSEEEILELFEMYHNNTIEGIALYNNRKTDDGIVIEYNNTKYYIVTSQGENADSTDSSLLRACEIFDSLNNDYSVIDINYYTDIEHMEIWFKSGYIDTDWGIVYYPPEISPPEIIPDKEKIEEMGNGFYTYVWFKG